MQSLKFMSFGVGSGIFYVKNFRYIMVPRDFLQDRAIRKALFGTMDSFDSDEQIALFMFYYLGLPLKDISEITRLPQNILFCLLALYSEKIHSKLKLFKNKSVCNIHDLIYLTEIFEVEIDEIVGKAFGDSDGEPGINERKNEIFEKIMMRIHESVICS